jgi:predicted TIM-barrel fold metal-dependent hydrolase
MIDCYGFLGPWPYWDTPDRTAAAAIARMDRFHIDACAVVSTNSIFYDLRAGNEEVLEAAARYPGRFIPFVSISPVASADLAQYRKRGARGVRLYPQHHHYALAQAGRVLSAAQDLKMPVVLAVRTIVHWGLPVLERADLEAAITKWPRVRFVVASANYGEEFWLMELMARHENVWVETSGMQGFRAIDYVAGVAGYRRVLFGAGLPLLNPACGVAKMEVCRLPRDQKAAIAEGNARELLGL